MFRSLQCTMINLFEARSVRWNDGVHASFKKTFWEGVQESSQLKGLRKFLGVSEQKNFIFKPKSKKLEAVSFTACLNCASFLAKMLIISIKQMNTIPSLSSVIKKIASKIYKRVMWSHSYSSANALNLFFRFHPKFPRARVKQTRWKSATFAYYNRVKPKLKSLSQKAAPAKGLGFNVLKHFILTFCWHSIGAPVAFAVSVSWLVVGT